tara:strand:+ start:1810 stop:2088 length:279 start_codon:yes stop_codon:yes gene_type:complete
MEVMNGDLGGLITKVRSEFSHLMFDEDSGRLVGYNQGLICVRAFCEGDKLVVEKFGKGQGVIRVIFGDRWGDVESSDQSENGRWNSRYELSY